MKPETMLYADSNHGQYIPQYFAQTIKRETLTGITPKALTVLENGPDEEWYWDEWEYVLDNATVTDEHGIKYSLWQDGDLWLIPEGMEWSDENECFQWPEEEESN